MIARVSQFGRWIPLSLVFRKRRLQARRAPEVSAARPSVMLSQSFFTRHLHYHTHESPRILRRGELREIIERERSEVAMLAVAPLPTPTSVFSTLLLRERGMETRLGSRLLRDVEQVQNRIHRIERIVREAESVRVERQSAGIPDALAAPALRQPRMRLQTVPDPAGRTPVRHERYIERPSTIRMEPPQSRIVRETLRKRSAAEAPLPTEARVFHAAQPPVQQVWRAERPSRESATETAAVSQQSSAAPPSALLPSAGIAAQTNASPASPAVARKFDGPEMDRLANDVMKRIERHVRIERERRGK